MSEKLYRLVLKLYPQHFRRAYGDEALRLVLDRAHDEKGFLRGLRLWFDLLVDLVISLPREYSKAPARRILMPKPAHGEPSFQLLRERSLNPGLPLVAALLTVASLWICVNAVAHSRIFPARFPADSYSLQAVVQSDVALAQSASDSAPVAAYSFCVTALHDIPGNPLKPLLRFHFAPPGASGAALIDGKVVKTFNSEQRLWISADVSTGNHWFVLRVDRPAENASISNPGDLKYCPAK